MQREQVANPAPLGLFAFGGLLDWACFLRRGVGARMAMVGVGRGGGRAAGCQEIQDPDSSYRKIELELSRRVWWPTSVSFPCLVQV